MLDRKRQIREAAALMCGSFFYGRLMGYLKKVWRGEERFVYVYNLWGFLGGLLSVLLFAAADTYFYPEDGILYSFPSPDPGRYPKLILLVFISNYYVFVLVGCWRSIRRHVDLADERINYYWACLFLAFLMSATVIVRMVFYFEDLRTSIDL